MALELSLLRWSLLPRFIQTGSEGPRKAHFLGGDKATPIEHQQETGGKNDNKPKKPSSGKYRELGDLTLGEVETALASLQPQLVEATAPGWIARNYFCKIPLKRNTDERPPLVFGRVTSSYPMAGELENIEELEMQFPRQNASPDLLHIYKDDIHRRKPIESFCVGIKAFLSEAEIADLSRDRKKFIEKGFDLVYQSGYGELLDYDEEHLPVLPLLYLFGSEWFATVPDSMQVEVKLQIKNLLRWNRLVLNFHPRRYLLQYRSLNDELEFNVGFTEQYLLTPQTADQVLGKVDEKFAEIFMQGMK